MVKHLHNCLGMMALTCGSVAAADSAAPASQEALLLELQQRVTQQQTLIDAQQRQIDRLIQMVGRFPSNNPIIDRLEVRGPAGVGGQPAGHARCDLPFRWHQADARGRFANNAHDDHGARAA